VKEGPYAVLFGEVQRLMLCFTFAASDGIYSHRTDEGDIILQDASRPDYEMVLLNATDVKEVSVSYRTKRAGDPLTIISIRRLLVISSTSRTGNYLPTCNLSC
jgi:hypothetical protein